MNDEITPTSRPLAVSYLRVSTKEQAERDGDPEGYSIPAQRDANRRKAEALGADIVAEFVDRGESARSADRPELKRMLQFVTSEPITYCIVHKVDRLARNRADDVEINLALTKAGARLVSATENIDETPSGMLLHGIMSSIAEFYSRNLANEVLKGLNQKARSGGTVSRAPMGYRNIRTLDAEGREARTVELDEERAPLIRWAFDRYAEGDISIKTLAAELEARGLTTPRTPKRPGRPIYANQLHKIFQNPYYKGDVQFQGVSYDGRHEALVTPVQWQKVQDVMAAHVVGEKVRSHQHYLNGSIFCARCGSRLSVQLSTNRHGVTYEYFICAGRHDKKTGCLQRAMLIDDIEVRVADLYADISLDAVLREQVEADLIMLLSDAMGDAEVVQSTLRRQEASLRDKQRKLLEAHYANAIPLELLRVEQEQIGAQLAAISERLDASDVRFETLRSNLTRALDLAQDCDAAYRSAPDHVRRWFNQAFFRRILIDDEGTEGELTSTMHELIRPARPRPQGQNEEPRPVISLGRGSETDLLVDLRGLEPLTPCMPCRCATSCATDPSCET